MADVKDKVLDAIEGDKRIHFLGWKPREELIEYLYATDFYVQPGGQSVTMQNAMCCGCAVMLYPYKSHKPYIQGNGYYISDVPDMIRVFRDILENPQRVSLMKEKSYKIAEKILDYQKLAERVCIESTKGKCMKNISQRVRKVSRDFLFNIAASVLITGVMQLILYPYLAQIFNANEYGELLTIMGIANTVIVSLGNTLNNTRLIVNSDYLEKSEQGDFNLLLLMSCGISIIIIIGVTIIFFDQEPVIIAGLILFAMLSIANTYYNVEFRLVLNFKKILLQNIIGAGGYLIGCLLLAPVQIWIIPFLLAALWQLIFLFFNTTLFLENWSRTSLFRTTVSKYLILILTGLSGNLIVYLDRLLLFPLLGGSSVSVYTVASFFGKTLGIVMTPIAGVLLGYYAQQGFLMSRKRFWYINTISAIGGAIFIIISFVCADFFTNLLYPTLFSQAEKYILIANFAATISAVCTLTQSALLKFAPTWVQIIKELVYVSIYIGLGIILLSKYGLMGFCWAAVLANFCKLAVLYLIGDYFIKRNAGNLVKTT